MLDIKCLRPLEGLTVTKIEALANYNKLKVAVQKQLNDNNLSKWLYQWFTLKRNQIIWHFQSRRIPAHHAPTDLAAVTGTLIDWLFLEKSGI